MATRNELTNGNLLITLNDERGTKITIDFRGNIIEEDGNQLAYDYIDKYGKEIGDFIRESQKLMIDRYEKLRNSVIDDIIKAQVQHDTTSLDCILQSVPFETLMASLPEGQKEQFKLHNLNNKKKFGYSVSTSVIWASFDTGEVEAHSKEEARKLAEKKLEYDFKKANEVLAQADVTQGFSIEFNSYCIQIEEITE